MPSSRFVARDAVEADVDALVAFTSQEALEAERRQLDEHTVRSGATAAFGDRPAARYWMAEDGAGAAVGVISVVKEWSNFHDAEYSSLQAHSRSR